MNNFFGELDNYTTDRTDNTDEEMIQKELSGKIIGAGMGDAYCARDNLANTTPLISMAESYPCYPCNPWFVRAFD